MIFNEGIWTGPSLHWKQSSRLSMLFLSSELLGGMWPCSLCNFFVVLPLLSCGLRRRSMASVAVWRFFGVELGRGLPGFMFLLFLPRWILWLPFLPHWTLCLRFLRFMFWRPSWPIPRPAAPTRASSSVDNGQSVISSSELKNRDCKRAIALMCISLVARTRVHCRERILRILSFSPAVLDAVV